MNIEDIQKLCSLAHELGSKQDLSNCTYGPTHREGKKPKSPSPYYYFLSGFVLATKSKNIIELGTYYGGSTSSMAKALEKDAAEAKLVTIDFNFYENELLNKLLFVKRITNNCLNSQTIETLKDEFKNLKIDLIFIDSTHTYEEVSKTFNVYKDIFNPTFILIDDINLNQGMNKFWNEIVSNKQFIAYDCSKEANRKEQYGIGLVANKQAL